MASGSVSGWLEKQGKGKRGPWAKRFFVLNGFQLVYYEDETLSAERGFLLIPGASVEVVPDKQERGRFARSRKWKHRFVLKGPHLSRDYHLAAETEGQRSRWMAELRPLLTGEYVPNPDPTPRPRFKSVFTPTPTPAGELEEGSADSSDWEVFEEVEDLEIEEEEEIPTSEEGDPEENGIQVDTSDEDRLKFGVLPLDCLRPQAQGGHGQNVSFMAVGRKLLVCGTAEGWIHIVSYTGGTVGQHSKHHASITDIAMDGQENHVAACSEDGIVSIASVHDSQEVSTVSLDRGAVAIALSPNFSIDSSRPLVAGVKGGRLLLLRRKGQKWHTSRVLYEDKGADGQIHAVKWRGDVMAVAASRGIRIYDFKSDVWLEDILRERDAPRADMYRCVITFESDTTLLIAWGNWVVCCKVKGRPAYERLDLSKPRLSVEVVYRYTTPDYFICGQAPLGDQLLLLSYSLDIQKMDSAGPQGLHPPPDLRVFSRTEAGLVEEQVYRLNIKGHEKLRAKDYCLVFAAAEARTERSGRVVQDEAMLFVQSPQEVLTCKPCGADDHVDWLVRHKRFADALEYTKHVAVHWPAHSADRLQEQHLMYLVGLGLHRKAAMLFRDYLRDDVVRWERWIFEYAERGRLGVVAPHVPLRELPSLNQQVYEMILHLYLDRDPKLFYQHVAGTSGTRRSGANTVHDDGRQLEFRLLDGEEDGAMQQGVTRGYRPAPVIKAAYDERKQLEYKLLDSGLSDEERGVLEAKLQWTCLGLAELYERTGRFADALDILLDLRDSARVFDLIARHDMHRSVTAEHVLQPLRQGRRVVKLLLTDLERGLALLMRDQGLQFWVVEELQRDRSNEPLLFAYLDRVQKTGGSSLARFPSLLPRLYAKYEPQGLTRLCVGTADQLVITYKEALELISDRRIEGRAAGDLSDADNKELWVAEALLRAKLQQADRVLEIYVAEIRDVHKAIQFIREECAGDREDRHELCRKLVDKCLRGGEDFVADLLDHIGEEEGFGLEAVDIIRQIGKKEPLMKIPEVKMKLKRIVGNKQMQLQLRKDLRGILQNDIVRQEQRQVSARVGGVAVRLNGTKCGVCSGPIQMIPRKTVDLAQEGWRRERAREKARKAAEKGKAGAGAKPELEKPEPNTVSVFIRVKGTEPRGVFTFGCGCAYHHDCYMAAWVDPGTRKPIPAADLARLEAPRKGRGNVGKVDPFLRGVRGSPYCMRCTGLGVPVRR